GLGDLYKRHDRNEVDIVLENRRGEIVGVEVKSSATVTSSDFSGMRRLAQACGDKFIQGLVLYDHDQVVPFADNMFAAPISSLWAAT
ncbi:MAG: AAA family ATPase, partial [Chloroflexi bacterium]|nr:AAA family ATPase [Chloroflexota bacterium]